MPTTVQTRWTHCYRMSSWYRNVGVVCTILFTLIGLGSTLAAYFNVDDSFPQPELAAVGFAVFWSAFVLLSIWLIVCYYKYRLFTNAHALHEVRVMSMQDLDLTLVENLYWRRFPVGGSVRLTSAFGNVKIELGHFPTSDRERLVQFFRNGVEHSKQSGWPEFSRQFEHAGAPPERAHRDSIRRAIVFFLLAIGFLIAWIAGLGVLHLALSFTNAILGAWVLLPLLKRRNAETAPAHHNERFP